MYHFTVVQTSNGPRVRRRTSGDNARRRTRGELRSWPLERVLFAMAGTVTLVSAVLAAVVSPWFLLLTAFVGVNQWLYVLVGACPASFLLRRTCRLRSAIYDNDSMAA